MIFYEELSSVYDIVFPWNKTTNDFLKETLNKDSKILDLGCGSGNYSISIAKDGYNVTGLDFDEQMIKNCISKATTENVDVNFIVSDMLKFAEITDAKFDRIFCIGNSLVHLISPDDISKLIATCYNELKPNGDLIIQIINYDRILRFNINALPTIDKNEEDIKFVRNYLYHEDTNIIDFNTELTVKKNGSTEVLENSVPLFPLTSDDLFKLLTKAGFTDIKFYGGFNKEKFSINSYALVVQGKK